MASSSASLPIAEAVHVLVSSLADESPVVRESSLSSLREIAPLNPLLVLDCCCAVSKAGRRRFSNMAGVFRVMAAAVRAMDREDVDPVFMARLAKIATSELVTSKELNADWQRAAATLLVSIGSHAPDLMMEEIFLHLSGPNLALPAMVQILADFASAEALQFTPKLKDVLLRILPILGSVRDAHRPIFANAFKCWCQAAWQYLGDFPSDRVLDSDVISFLNSVFELLLRVWASCRDLKVRLSSVEALGEMVGLITRSQLKAALPRLVPTILDLYRRDQECAYLATHSLHNLLTACLLSENGPPLLDFEELTSTLSTLLPVAFINNNNDKSNFSMGLKTYNEIQHCFLVIGSVYAEDLYVFLLNICQTKDEPSIVGALCVLKHLLPRLLEAWHGKRTLLTEVVKSLLDEQSLGVRMALAELLVVMASHCYFSGPSAEMFIEFLVRQCAISDEEVKDFRNSKEAILKNGPFQPFRHKKMEVMLGQVCPEELRAICEKGLLLLAITIPEMECYGLTETSGPVTLCDGVKGRFHLSIGRLIPTMEAKIVDVRTGKALPPNKIGELLLRGPPVMQGYLKNPEATSLAIDNEGWLRIGDLCYIDSRGLVYIVDRIKELIKYKAYQVAPAELEEILSGHPDISDIAVMPYPDEEAGEIPMACVVRKAGARIKEEDIISFMEKKVAPYMFAHCSFTY